MLKHPDIDCVFLNAGVQNRYIFADSSSFDLLKFNNEMTVNFTSVVALTHAFLPHLLKKEGKRGFIFTGTHLSLIPAPILPAYSASKAALDAFLVCLREQMRSTEVAVIHLSPPIVQSTSYPCTGLGFGMLIRGQLNCMTLRWAPRLDVSLACP
jgi:short-subunit dehydrogenase involved in D-alanine esterification of teichoic acids